MKNPNPNPINPRVRAYGKARIDIARRVQSQQDWDSLWKAPQNPFPFKWGDGWQHCIEYRVEDFAAEVGFFIDTLGFSVNAFGPDYAQFTSPDGSFCLGVGPATANAAPTPPESIRLQFKITGLGATAAELEKRGVVFDRRPQAVAPRAALCLATFRTPHGISVDLWEELTVSNYSLEPAGSTKNTRLSEAPEGVDDHPEEIDPGISPEEVEESTSAQIEEISAAIASSQAEVQPVVNASEYSGYSTTHEALKALENIMTTYGSQTETVRHDELPAKKRKTTPGNRPEANHLSKGKTDKAPAELENEIHPLPSARGSDSESQEHGLLSKDEVDHLLGGHLLGSEKSPGDHQLQPTTRKKPNFPDRSRKGIPSPPQRVKGSNTPPIRPTSAHPATEQKPGARQPKGQSAPNTGLTNRNRTSIPPSNTPSSGPFSRFLNERQSTGSSSRGHVPPATNAGAVRKNPRGPVRENLRQNTSLEISPEAQTGKYPSPQPPTARHEVASHGSQVNPEEPPEVEYLPVEDVLEQDSDF